MDRVPRTVALVLVLGCGGQAPPTREPEPSSTAPAQQPERREDEESATGVPAEVGEVMRAARDAAIANDAPRVAATLADRVSLQGQCCDPELDATSTRDQAVGALQRESCMWEVIATVALETCTENSADGSFECYSEMSSGYLSMVRLVRDGQGRVTIDGIHVTRAYFD